MRNTLILLGTFFLFFFGLNTVNASVVYGNGVGLKCGVTNKVTGLQTCDLGFEITEKAASSFNTITVTFTTINSSFTQNDIALEDTWRLTPNEEYVYTFTTTETRFEVGYHKIATITVHKDLTASKCAVRFDYEFTKVNRACSVYEDIYYGKSGEQVDFDTYDDECNNHYCIQIEDEYYGKYGKKVTEEEYKEQCDEYKDHYCVAVDDDEKLFYDNEGDLVEEEEYLNDCFNHFCEQIGETYYDSEGNIVEEEEYLNDCFPHICKQIEDKYYDIEGNPVTEDEFHVSCDKKELVICGIDDEENYYDNEGNKVSKEEYEKECFTHHCEVIDNTYYDNNGNVVDKDTYNKYCVTPDTPKTGLNIPLIVTAILMVLAGGIFSYVKKKNKFY